jgi:prepilin-type N-terminal cleavage/methylation domain-containing protein
MPFRSPRRHGRRTFTLIELLVVVAIIALLISILLPALSRAKGQARQLMCLTNLRSLGEAARLYAADNRGFVPRGIQGFTTAGGGSREYAIFPTCVVGYLGYDGDTWRLWGAMSQPKKRRVNEICRTIPQFQCPDYPLIEDPDFIDQPTGDSPYDYVVSAMPMPYHQSNIDADTAGDLEWDYGGGYEGEHVDGYMEASRIEDIPIETNASDMIYLTESHTSLPWGHQSWGLRFHTVFLASQLPFGGLPRVANDQRHPAGIDALFFDGHGRVMDHHEMDPGWPNSLDKRLRWFTVMPDWWTP